MPYRWPLKFTVSKPGEITYETDRFGNETPVQGPDIPVQVFSVEIVQTEELGGDSILRTIEDCRIIAPPDTFTPEDTIDVGDGTRWAIQGHPEDNRMNPYFDAGLVTYHARRTEG